MGYIKRNNFTLLRVSLVTVTTIIFPSALHAQYEESELQAQPALSINGENFEVQHQARISAAPIAGKPNNLPYQITKHDQKKKVEKEAPQASAINIGHSSLSSENKMEIIAEFEFGDSKRKVHSIRTIYVENNYRDWFGLSKPSDGIVWLARIVQKNSSDLEVEYMIVDLQKDDVVLTIPKMKAPFDQKIIIQSDRANEKLSFSFSVKPYQK